MNELTWIGPALVFGFIAARLGMPPMVGYLIGGFIMNLVGVGDAETLAKMGELGVTLLLFTIGLKLDVRSLLKPYVWAGATLHMLAVVVIFGIILFWVSLTGLETFAEVDFTLAFLIAFALSFSSTVFAVKILEEKGEMPSRHGQIAIGILIMQDIIAVVFLALSTGKIPSLWALALFGLFPLRRLLMHLMTRAGHGELLILYGLALPLGVWSLFELVGMKGDLGALVIGALLAAHPSAGEASKRLMGLKDLLLVGFFLGIGTAGSITISALLIAILLAIAVIVKLALYFLILTQFRLRSRTSFLTSLSLANYSEFGLIIGAVALANGWLSGDWLVIIALALTITFIVAAPLNAHSAAVLASASRFIGRFEKTQPLPEDVPIDTGTAKIAIIGMERLGTGAYETLKQKYGDVLIGTSSDPAIVERHQAAGRNVILADATDEDFWSRVDSSKLKVGLLAMPRYEENLGVAQHIQHIHCDIGHRFAVVDYPDQAEALKSAGVNASWDMDTEAGIGFAEEVIRHLGDSLDLKQD
jgi:glutathione-regulated potassium-efflux system ancillary protein KefC